MKLKSVLNGQSMSEESVSCIAVKEDRHQNIMSSDALKNGVEEPWTIESVAKFIDFLCDREITRKKDRTSHRCVQKSRSSNVDGRSHHRTQ